MAIVDFEGYDRETSLTLGGWLTDTGGSVSADLAGTFNYGRRNGNTGAGAYTGRYFPNAATLQAGWINLHRTLNNAGGYTLIELMDNGTVQLKATILADGRCQILRNGTVLVASTNTLAFNTTHFVQLGFSVANAGGTAELWVNNVLMCSYVGDTQESVNAYVNRWRLEPSLLSYVDNVIVYSLVGDAPTARTPETRIIADLPNGIGSDSGFTPSAGVEWENVDEQPNDGDTTYNSAAAAVLTDTYACPANVPAGCIVYAVGIEAVVRKDDAGVNEVDLVLNSAGVVYPKGLTLALTTTYTRLRTWWSLNPATGAAWASAAPANAAQPGIRRTT